MPPQIKYRDTQYRLKPGNTHRPKNVRGAYIYNLVDCIQVCLLRRDLDRARRAWAILVRCPDVHWYDLWLWGLYLLTDGADKDGPAARFSQHEPGAEGERYLRSVLVSARESAKPVILAELVQHLIREGRYRAALDELETYLSSFTYLSSAPLLTYAGLVCFYLAQPESARGGSRQADKADETRALGGALGDEASEDGSYRGRSMSIEQAPPNADMLRQARSWFSKALKIDPELAVAKEFARLIDGPTDRASDDEMDLDSAEGDADRSWEMEHEEKNEEGKEGGNDDDQESDKWDDTDEDKSDSDDGQGGRGDARDADMWRLHPLGMRRGSSSE